ncbi:MAG: 1-acyl-sn-glycerol-3-phosphate acyltransferase [Bacteroidaceae bacterium]|nr:1-acyl-sn-glycerol-3-phosphate acyltransferase [Bacteroidaceae bacterium]
MIPAEFDEIRPYVPEELPAVYEELIADPEFQAAMGYVFKQIPFEQVAALMRASKTNFDFQKALVYPFLQGLLAKFSKGISLTFDNKESMRNALCLSNHRDIILDSAFLCLLMVEHIDNTVEIAIGDNLLIRPWIKKLVRVNRSFIVQRSASLREMLASSKRLSSYIHHTIVERRQPVWIAQREGRAKDSNDATQEGLLKMLSMYAGGGDIFDALKVLNIAPTTISYEFDPCDYLKAKEFQQKRDNPEHKKSPMDDLINMQTGLFGYKGAIHYHIADVINDKIDALDRTMPKNERTGAVARIIDNTIHRNYRLWPVNYYFYELLTGDTQYADRYTAADKEQLDGYLAAQIAKVDLENKDEAFLRTKILEMYANPLKNYIKAHATEQ